MTSRDFELIAAVLYRSYEGVSSEAQRKAVWKIVCEFCEVLPETNPRFNAAMFIAACRGE